MTDTTSDQSRPTAANRSTLSQATAPPGWEIISSGIPSERGGTVIITSGLHDAAHFIGDQKPKPVLSARLVVTDEEPVRFSLASNDARFVVGRSRGTCNAIVADPLVSRMHFSIGIKEDAPYIEDHGSTNGTYVDRIKIDEPTTLHNGAHIRFGHTEVLFEFD